MASELRKPELIPFHGDRIKALPGERVENPNIIFKHTVEQFGLEFLPHYKRLKRQPWATVAKMGTVGADGKRREMVVVDLRTFMMWLATIDTRKIADDDIRRKIVAYQNEAADAILDHFKAKYGARGSDLTTPTSMPDLFKTVGNEMELYRQRIGDLEGRLSDLSRDFYGKGLNDIDDGRNMASVASTKVNALCHTVAEVRADVDRITNGQHDQGRIEDRQEKIEAEVKELKDLVGKATPTEVAAWKCKDIVEVHDSRSYRATHGTWEDWAREVLGLSRSAAYHRLDVARGKPPYKRKPKNTVEPTQEGGQL